MHASSPPLLDARRADAADGPAVIVSLATAAVRATPMHSHARGQAIGAVSGLLAVSTQGERLIVPPGHVLWMPPAHPHGLDAHGPASAWSAHVAAHACAALPARPQVMAVSGLLREAVARAAAWRALAVLDAAQARVCAVILDEIAAAPRPPLVLPMPRERRLRAIALALAEHPADPRTLTEWAAWAGITPRTLTRRYTAETGLAFSAWRQRARLLRSLELLAVGQPVTTVALELGYDSLSAFIAMFRRAMGVSPGAYVDGQGRTGHPG
ncbi:MAG TPA: AraC family transcriptional regulator [Telluria sp.]|nr:AraC family transcriptional regulator [Telluria sp.]